MQAAFAPGVETMLLNKHVTVSRFAAFVAVSPGKSIKFPPTVHLTRYGSA
jgi:hypothetical protein